MKKNSYAIIGSGALGGLYGGMLANAGFDVHFLFNSDYQHVCDHGLKVNSKWGDFHLPHVNAYDSAEKMPACDVTIVALKTVQNHLLPTLLPSPTRDGGVVLVLQNGLNIESASADVVGADRVLSGCCFLCSNKVAPGEIHHLDYGRIVFGEYGKNEITPRAQQICDELLSANVESKVAADVNLVRWRKLMWNITFNGLSVALNASTKEIVDSKDASDLAESIIREVHAGAASCGANVPAEAIDVTMEHTREMVPYDSSMRIDYLNQRPMELDAIFGNPIAATKAQGHEMPRVEMLYQTLQFMDQRHR